MNDTPANGAAANNGHRPVRRVQRRPLQVVVTTHGPSAPVVPEALYGRLKRHRVGGGAYLPDFIARRKELTPAEKLVLGRIWGLAYKSGKFWEHPEGTAEALGLSESTVHAARARFDDLGLIKEYWRRPKDGRRYFHLLLKHDWLEEWRAHVLEQKKWRESNVK